MLGLSTKTLSLKTGNCLCAHCHIQSSYTVKRDTVFFSALFIPLIPLYANRTYAQCSSCKTVYIPSADQLNAFSITSEQVYTIAPLVKRMLAFGIDILLLVIATMFLATFIGKNPGLKAALPANFMLVFLPCWFFYFFLTELLSKGYSVGKKLLSVKVSNNNRLSYLNIGQLFCRNLIKTACCLFPPLFIVASFTNRNRAIHDLAANSVVISKLRN